ncbi:MAG: sel1 repeat family protein [Alphaproteobacteria bacterium]|nr:sel1 repeat family protein [Alphaproteobacteria bacterium]QQS57274.1 MAG: sel1 repeat family protein [Alphaproteobacteria bacterium]
MHLLALEYQKGLVVTKDHSKAFAWLEKAAMAGFGNAQIDLGRLYFNGSGIPKDADKARHWYQKASEQGDPTTLHNLALLYYEGRDVDRDYKRAFDLFLATAKSPAINGESFKTERRQAARFIGIMYFNGWGTKTDKSQALKWYESAATNGDAYGHFYAGNIYLTGDGAKQDDERALRHFQQAADNNLPEAFLALGNAYVQGTGVQKDLLKAGELYANAANGSLESAKAYLEQQFSVCTDDPQIDDEQAESCILAAGAGYPLAQSITGAFYHSGTFVPKDHEKSVALFRKAAEQGDIRAQTMLGTIYGNGEGVGKSVVESYAWAYVAVHQVPKTEFEQKLIESSKAAIDAKLANMTPDEKAAATDKASVYMKQYIR